MSGELAELIEAVLSAVERKANMRRRVFVAETGPTLRAHVTANVVPAEGC